MKLTAAAVAALALPAGVSDFVWWDSEIAGLGYRLRASGRASWVFQYRHARRSRRLSAKFAAVSAAAARLWAKQAASKAALGQDPAARAEPQPEEISTGEAVGLYIDFKGQHLRPRSLIELRRHLLKHAVTLHRLPLIKIDRRAIAALLAQLGKSNGPIAADNTRRDLSAFFAWTCREGLRDDNPVTNTNKFGSKPRERLLSDAEATLIWLSTTDFAAGPYSAIVRLSMLLGTRRQELGGLLWDEIDFENATISLPPERTKNGRAHIIPLPAAALEILKAQKRREGVSHVFAGERGRAFKGWSRNKAALDRRSGVKGWTLHDLRRYFSTSLHERLGIAPHICESLLGHQQAGVASVYNRSTYAVEKRRALDAWAAHLLVLVEGRPAETKVVAFAGRPSGPGFVAQHDKPPSLPQ